MLLSKLYQVSSKEDRNQTIEQIKKDLFVEKLDFGGTQNIIKQLDCLEKEDFTEILNEFIERNGILASMKHGSSYKILLRLYEGLSDSGRQTLLEHCIYKQDLFDISTGKYSGATVRELVSRMNESELEKLIQLIDGKLVKELSKDSTGAFLVSKLIQLETHKRVMRKAEENLSELVVHPIGNYIVQECFKKMEDGEHLFIIEKIKGDFKHIASTQHGSIVIKQFMTVASDRVLEQFFDRVILPDFKIFASSRATPALDIVFARINFDGKLKFVEKLSRHVMDVIGTTQGSIFTQKLIKKFSEPLTELFLQNIKPQIRPIMEETSSSFVIPALFDHCSKQGKKEIIISLKPHILEMSYNRNSSRVLQHILSTCDRGELDSIVLLLLSNFDNVITHESSAPVFQMIVERGFGESVFLRMKGNMLRYASHPLGSYVVSQCIKSCKKSVTDQILMELLVDDASNDQVSENKVLTLVNTKSGSFVILDCLQLVSEKYANQAVYDSLLNTLSKNSHSIRTASLKKRITELCEKRGLQ